MEWVGGARGVFARALVGAVDVSNGCGVFRAGALRGGYSVPMTVVSFVSISCHFQDVPVCSRENVLSFVSHGAVRLACTVSIPTKLHFPRFSAPQGCTPLLMGRRPILVDDERGLIVA